MESSYGHNLIGRVINASKSSIWESAVLEWIVDDCEEDESRESACICGKEHLRYLYTIRNIEKGRILWPIGSCCIKKFKRADMDEAVSVTEGMFKLLHAIRNSEYITLTPEYFSRKLLKKLLDDEAFVPNEFNHYDGENDYQFMLDMFNKQNKDEITSKQWRKIRGIIVGSIKPYLEEQLAEKIRQR